MNLFELQERLKDFSQDQLVREMQAPTGTAPQYLVLSELQRRQRMMAEEQAQMQAPQTTVAEDAIAAAGVPQGGLADMAQAMAPQTDMDMNTAVQPVERMQEGGSVDGRDSGFIRRLLENVRERGRNSRMTDDEIAYTLGRQSFNVPEFMSPVAALRDASDLYEEGDYPGAVLNAASALPAGRIMGPALNVYAEMYNRSGDDDVEGMRNGGVVRMQPGGLAGISRDLDVYSPTMGGGRASSRPRLVVRNGIQYAQMADGSLIAVGELGFSEADQAGAGTADLAPPRGFPSQDTGPLPTQADLDQRFFEEQFGIGGRPLPPELSMGSDAIMPGSDTAQNALGRIRPTQFVPARDMELPLVESLTGESSLDIRVPPSAASLGFGGSGFDIENLTEEQLEEYNSLTPEQQENVRLYGVPGPRPSDPTFGGATAAIEGALGPDPLPAPSMTIPEAIRAYEEFEQRGPTLQDILSGRAAVPGTFEAEAEADDAVRAEEALQDALATAATFDEEALAADREIAALPGGVAPVVRQDGGDGGGAGGAGGGAGASAPAGDDAFEQDKWLALAQAGLALMSSQQPTIGGAIGEAGLAGITALRQARGERDERISAQQARADRLAAAAARGERDAISGTERAAYFRAANEATAEADALELALARGGVADDLGMITPYTEEELAILRRQLNDAKSRANIYSGISNPSLANIQATLE